MAMVHGRLGDRNHHPTYSPVDGSLAIFAESYVQHFKTTDGDYSGSPLPPKSDNRPNPTHANYQCWPISTGRPRPDKHPATDSRLEGCALKHSWRNRILCEEATRAGVPVLELERVTLPLHSTHRIDLESRATDCSHQCYSPPMVEAS